MHPAITFDSWDNFPAHAGAAPLLRSLIREHGLRSVLDIGGGARPILDDEIIREERLDLTLLDISAEELSKAHASFRKIQCDVTTDTAHFVAKLNGRQFDLVFSHMFLEHVRNPLQAHRNILEALRPGGFAVHFYPSPNNLPLTLNRLLPEKLTDLLLRLAQPWRDLTGRQGKFPAYYELCGPPSGAQIERFERLGYQVRRYTGYVGHDYYNRFSILAACERAIRKPLLKLGVPMTSGCLLVMQRPQTRPPRPGAFSSQATLP